MMMLIGAAYQSAAVGQAGSLDSLVMCLFAAGFLLLAKAASLVCWSPSR